MPSHSPETLEELCGILAESASSGRTISVEGNATKRSYGGPAAPTEISVSTAKMNRVLQYEPRDLTISVEAGMPYAELTRILDENRQMVPLDPPFSTRATIGGVLAANTNGPRRRLYGSARDLLIGMKFVTLEGKVIQSGGMVVKNVAGLDMGKLMIGSFGTLAAIAVTNFKLLPKPEATRTFLFSAPTLEEAVSRRSAILQSPLQPAALDLLNPAAAAHLDEQGWLLALQAGGSPKLLNRYSSELPGAHILEGGEEVRFWEGVREFVPRFLADSPEGVAVRASSTLRDLSAAVSSSEAAVLARAGNGVFYFCFPEPAQAAGWIAAARARGWKVSVEAAPEQHKPGLAMWEPRAGEFEIMERIKGMFDPRRLLNPGRLYGRI